jgi:hypothetical protein
MAEVTTSNASLKPVGGLAQRNPRFVHDEEAGYAVGPLTLRAAPLNLKLLNAREIITMIEGRLIVLAGPNVCSMINRWRFAMRTFAKKPNVRQPAAGSRIFRPARTAQQHEGNALHRATSTDASQRQIGAGTAATKAETTADRLNCQMPAASAGLQTDLKLGMPGDVHEQEADRVAGQVMRTPEPSMQSKAAAELSGHAMTPAVRVQTKSTHAGDTGGAAARASVHDVLRSTGQPLDAATRAFMEPRFGQDFGGVRVHADARAAESARSVRARAYTVGQHVAFRTDSYRPGTPAGQHLLAHELAHVVQQSRAGGPAGLHRQVDQASPAEDDPWKKALLEAKRSVFGSAAGKPFQLDAAASSLNQPGHDPFFPHHFLPAASQGIGSKDDRPSYAKNPAGSQHGAAPSDSIGPIGLRPDELTSQGSKIRIGPFGIGAGKTIDTDEQQRSELKKVKEKTTASKLFKPEFKRQQTGAKLNVLGKYGGGDAGGEKSLKLDLNKVSVALEAQIPLSLAKTWFAKKKKLNDAFDDSVKKSYTAEDIKTAAWNIIQHEARVRNAFLFYSQIMHNFPESEWDAELEKFFQGEHSAKVKLRRNLRTSGATPSRYGWRKHKVTRINSRSDFALAVATYLHEMTHYADIWYSSRAPKKKHRREGAEWTAGIDLPSADKLAAPGQKGVKHLSKDEQTSARIEATDETIEQILKDMQSPVPWPHEHPRLAHRERKRFFRAKRKSGFNLDAYLAGRKAKLRSRADNQYEAWRDPETGNNLLELGFAFDKEAYGFDYDPKQKKNWAEQFMGKFEVLFDDYLHW